MRTGSNFLESNLNALEGLTCHGEVFNPFFIGGEGKQDLFGIDLAGRNADPAGFLRAMQAHTKGLSGFRYFSDHDPRVFDLLIQDQTCAKIILTRNQLESFISWKIAKQSDQWWLANTKHLKTVRPTFDLMEFLQRIDDLSQFHAKLTHALQVTGQTAFTIDYDDVLDLDVLNGLAAFLGVPAGLEKLVFRFKKQNPEPIEEKVANPDEMRQALSKIDWFNQSHRPNFEPRRYANLQQYFVGETVPLIFMPVKFGPERQVKKWLQSYGNVQNNLDRTALRKWKEAHPGQRSFAVLRHPLARAHAIYCDFLEKEWMPELRPYLKRVHKFQLPPKGKAFETEAEFREGFKVFLELFKHIFAGRTELRTLTQFASQTAILQGFAYLQSPDFVLREDRLQIGLDHIAAEVGLAPRAVPAVKDNCPYSLESLYGPDLEALARDAYGRDYSGFGFGDWQP